ncbi:hypothetical protein EVAR_76227_1 [Eumeta japonica]|uniref:Uncharacterized protein n=1 Tax=Eumeta variegata TaxID=151549 RepID=A0A4C1UNT7_EUMVA|nr:hypothetical protein EVAR_76227_1 [Eumeta japonica]
MPKDTYTASLSSATSVAWTLNKFLYLLTEPTLPRSLFRASTTPSAMIDVKNLSHNTHRRNLISDLLHAFAAKIERLIEMQDIWETGRRSLLISTNRTGYDLGAPHHRRH